MCSLLIWLDNTVLSTTLETLADPVRGLNAGPAELQWATGSYPLAFATLILTAGALPARSTAIAVFSTSAGVGMTVGPVLAGVLLDHFWWGSVFLVDVPVVVLALIGLALLVPNFRSPAVRPLGPAAMLLSITGLAAPAYGLIRAGQVAAWGRTDVWAPIVVGPIPLAVFVRVELRSKMPSFDPRLLAQRAFGGGNAALGLLLFAVSAVTFYNAFYLQGVRGYSPIEAGLAGLPTALGAIFGAPHAMHVGAVWIMFVALFGAAVLLLALRSVRKPAAAGGVPEPARDGGPTADQAAPRAGAENLTAREGAGVGSR
ncbi:MFS transporter [Actinoallomurus rhizosphaericola]|uniref:MFS transporter n=1 Tax=Actinoallomurus rhizosphaericola TaxID=2952536 RepID=UPI002092A243|nr:MFS transporter [Actinoallomurus rhizosphaericola]MCO5996670.1 MFS transporter [Actinoallomurus rhizosphaericola]